MCEKKANRLFRFELYHFKGTRCDGKRRGAGAPSAHGVRPERRRAGARGARSGLQVWSLRQQHKSYFDTNLLFVPPKSCSFLLLLPYPKRTAY